MVIVAIICLAAVVISVAVILSVIIYHQMLLINEVNKRLLLLTTNAVERESFVVNDLEERLSDLTSQMPTSGNPPISSVDNEDEPFDPHNFSFEE